MVRRTDVPPQKMYGNVPLQLPLIRMSEAEAIIMHGQPQIYDSPYPLDYDGTGLAPNWSSMGYGMDGLGLTPAQQKAQAAAAAKRVAAQIAAAERRQANAAHQQMVKEQTNAMKAAKAQQAAEKNQAQKQAQQAKQEAEKIQRIRMQCRAKHGIFDESSLTCQAPYSGNTPPVGPPMSLPIPQPEFGPGWTHGNAGSPGNAAQQACAAQGGFWNGTVCQFQPIQVPQPVYPATIPPQPPIYPPGGYVPTDPGGPYAPSNMYGFNEQSTFGNVAMLPGEVASQNMLHRTQVTIPYNAAAVHQKIADRRLRLPPRTFAAHARAYPATFGNLAMMPFEVRQMSGLGLTQAQINAQAKAAANKAAADAKKQAAAQAALAKQQAAAQAKQAAANAAAAKKQAAADAATAKQQAAAAAKQVAADAAAAKKQATADAAAQKKTDAATAKAAVAANKQQSTWAAFQAACAAQAGGAWDDTAHTCSGYPTIKDFQKAQKLTTAQDKKDAAAAAKADKAATKQQAATDRATCLSQAGMKWDAKSGTCIGKPITAAQLKKLVADCAASGGSWDGQVCTSAQAQCATSGGYWNGTACVAKSQQDCVSGGGTWDPTTGVCQSASMLAQQQCAASGGTWNGTACVAPGTVDSSTIAASIAQCTAQQGFWDGSQCIPPQSFTNPNGIQAPIAQQSIYPPQTSAIPPGYDGGGGGGGGMPMTGGGGSGQPMMNDPGNQYSPSVDQEGQTPDDQSYQTDQTADQSQTDEQQNGETKDEDAMSQVASGNILESISKLFSGGMNGVGCGRNSVPAWVGMGGPNVPQFAVAQTTEPIKSSTTAGVIAGSVVLVAVAAAIFLWSKGKK